MSERNSYSVARFYRLKNTSYNLNGNICAECGEPQFPPRPSCLNMNGESEKNLSNNIEEETETHEKNKEKFRRQ